MVRKLFKKKIARCGSDKDDDRLHPTASKMKMLNK